jgi:hypothetical protein
MPARPIRFFLLFTLFASCCFGQAGRAELIGEVRDPDGLAIAGARVTATETRTSLSFSGVTSAAGGYTITSVLPGRYLLAVEAQGFKRMTREGIQVATGERVRIDFDIVIGNASEVISVTADAPLLRTDSGSLGQVISDRSIEQLPLNGRSFISLVGLAAGIANPPGSVLPRINGGRPRVNEWLYDGVSVSQPEGGQVAFTPIIDAIQEFKLEGNSPPAEFGRFDGGVVNLTTKSGTNEFHGTVWEFLRNEALNARNLFAPATAANPNKPVFRRNQFGGVSGGPIQKDKTFFFVDYQGTRQSAGRTRISTVPTLLRRQGIFTEPIGGRVVPIYDPATTSVSPTGASLTRDPFPNNTIPMSRFDPVAIQLLNRYPLPTSSGTANNYSRVGNEPSAQDQFDGRVDHRFSDRDVLFGRYSYARDSSSPVTPLPDGSGAITTGAAGPTRVLGQSIAANYLHTFNARASNELRFGYTPRSVNVTATQANRPIEQELGLPGIPSNGAFGNTLPTFTINGFQQLGSPSNTATNLRTDVAQVVDIFYLRRGTHSLKFGTDLRWKRLDVIQPPQPTGSFNFNTLFTDFPNRPNTGISLASFLLGQVNTFNIDLQEKALRPRAQHFEPFIQDDWQVGRRLTVNAGLRWTINMPSTDLDDQGAIFNLATQKLDYIGNNGNSRTARRIHWRDFGPRVGLAFRISDRTVLRAGFGGTWIEHTGISSPFTIPPFPFLQSLGQRTLNNLDPAFILRNGPQVTPLALTPDAGLGQGVFAVDRDLTAGFSQQWNLAIQQEVGRNLVFEIAYAGNKITHIGMPDVNINQLTVDQLKQGAALLATAPNPFVGVIPRQSSLGNPTITAAQLMKPFPQYTTVDFYRSNVGNSSYHSLQAKLEKRFSNGLSFLASYTRSKLLDDASSVFGASVLTAPLAIFPVADAFNRHLERDVSLGDIPNVFVTSWTYDLPFGSGRKFDPSGLAGKLLSGWGIAGVATYQSGLPLALTQATNFNAFAGFGSQRPNVAGDVNTVAGGRSAAQWFNTKAFQAAAQFTIGTASRNPVRGPGYRNTDFALSRSFQLPERLSFEFRAEVFNLTNTPPLGNPATILGNADFGSIMSAGDPRVVQLCLKLKF